MDTGLVSSYSVHIWPQTYHCYWERSWEIVHRVAVQGHLKSAGCFPLLRSINGNYVWDDPDVWYPQHTWHGNAVEDLPQASIYDWASLLAQKVSVCMSVCLLGDSGKCVLLIIPMILMFVVYPFLHHTNKITSRSNSPYRCMIFCQWPSAPSQRRQCKPVCLPTFIWCCAKGDLWCVRHCRADSWERWY